MPGPFHVREVLTRDDLIRVGACIEGIKDFVEEHGLDDETAVSACDLHAGVAEWAEKAAAGNPISDGYGYGNGDGNGYGDGYGYGNGDGDGDGDGHGEW